MWLLKIVAESWHKFVCSDDFADYQDKWICDEYFFQILRDHHPTLEKELGSAKLTRSLLNKAIPKTFDYCDNMDNEKGIFRFRQYMKCPFGENANNRRVIWFYMVSKSIVHASIPTPAVIKQALESRKRRSTRVAQSSGSIVNPLKGCVDNGEEKSDRDDMVGDEEDVGVVRDEELEAIPKSAQLAKELNYWNSSNAKRLFYSDADKANGTIDCKDVMQRRIGHLRQVSIEFEGWKYMVYGCDQDHAMSEFAIHRLKQKCQLLCYAYIFALDNMPQKSWRDCCQLAVDLLNPVGVITKASTLMDAKDGSINQKVFSRFCAARVY